MHVQMHLQENAGKGPFYFPGKEYYCYQGFTPDELLEALLLTTRPLSCINQTLAGEQISTAMHHSR